MWQKLKHAFKRFYIKNSVKRNKKQAIVMIDGGICS